ncbi:hypothetical protein BUALT_Bualt01G0211900 [Buddleja alternifolia]|uniref:Uncharacterized protein n=1 Tax=Buddleja alternifolia TaxID=168488 RepID=A0AAV6Y9V8_9LAMI|nr:hypothetical protein BUALT_Bualt01G0211900 [Buddleja alternifolia]
MKEIVVRDSGFCKIFHGDIPGSSYTSLRRNFEEHLSTVTPFNVIGMTIYVRVRYDPSATTKLFDGFILHPCSE